MNDLEKLAALIKQRNLIEESITTLINRPALMGHIGEHIASKIFGITLERSANTRAIDGIFNSQPLKGHTVNIKWYGKCEGILDITPNSLPDYYLILTGPKSNAVSSYGTVRPWLIDYVFLFDSKLLLEKLQESKIKIGIATSVRHYLWVEAQIYPTQQNRLIPLSDDQRCALSLFGSTSRE